MNTKEKHIRDALGLKLPKEGFKNYSVKAGAGGGKTTMLSGRICQQLLMGTPIEEFVIITYTNAAAAELREKVTNALRRIIEEKSVTSKELDRAVNALDNIELMQISTIHAFLLRLLKENSFESGVVMDAVMLDSQEEQLRKKKFFDKWYEENFDKVEQLGDMWVRKNKSGGKAVDHKRDVIENMFYDMANIREDVVYSVTDATKQTEQEAAKYIAVWEPHIKRLVTKIKDNWPDNKDGTKKKLNKAAEEIVEAAQYINSPAINLTQIEKALNLSKAVEAVKVITDEDKSIYNRVKTADIPELYNELNSIRSIIPEDEYERSFEVYKEYIDNAAKTAKTGAYVTLICGEYHIFTDSDAGKISNDDILYRADKMLRSHREVLDKLRRSYSKIYVDEFQDTTRLQSGIILMLSEKPGSEPETKELEEDKLLIVGDPKQSIYRFTGAEKRIYDNVDAVFQEKPDNLAESVQLDSNFRSNSDIVSWVNNCFSSIMGSSYTPMETDWDIKEKEALHGVYKYDEPVDAEGNPVKYDRSCDVAEVTELVRQLVNNTACFIEEPVRLPDGTYDKPQLRSIRYSDIMIICRNAVNITKYVDRFAEMGIPVNVQGKFYISGDVVLKNYKLLVDYFADYKNKNKRIAALQIVKGVDATCTDEAVIKETQDWLRNKRKYFIDNNMGTAAIAQYLMVHEELFVPKNHKIAVEGVRAYRIRLHQMVETCLARNNGDLSDYAQLLDNYINSEVKREIPLESNENAIRLMNAHQSKGLTANVVIIADRSSKEMVRFSSFRKNGSFYPAAAYKVSAISAPEYFPAYGSDRQLMRQAVEDELKEACRLQYVAATRAAHALIIMPAINNAAWFTDNAYTGYNEESINKWLNRRKNDNTEYELVKCEQAVRENSIRLEQLSSNAEQTDINSLSGVRCISITPSGLEELESVTGYSVTDEWYSKEERPSGNVFGDVMHRAYQLIFERISYISNTDKTEGEKLIERAVNQAVAEKKADFRSQDSPQKFKEFLCGRLNAYYDKVIRRIADEAVELYPEYAFSFYVSDEERNSFIEKFSDYLKLTDEESKKTEPQKTDKLIWINGQADLVVKKKDGSIKIYDYKSDAMNGKPEAEYEKALNKKYEGQLALYQYALSKAFGVDKVDTELIHLYM